jgi:hypothetical protein
VYVKYSLHYNFGVLFLFAALVGILRHYANLPIPGTLLFSAAALFGWIWGWGCDTLFLVCRDEQFQRWKDKIQGKDVDAEIEDQCYILRRWACGYLNCEGLCKWARSYVNKFSSSMASYLPKKKYTKKSPPLSPARWCPHATATLENSWRRGFCDRRDPRRHSAFLRRQRHHMGERERSRDPAERTKKTVRGFCYN